MKSLRNSKGFTLIELIIIIIILGILAAVAIPRYIDMKSAASDATAKGILGALRGANSILFARLALSGTAYGFSDVTGNAQISGVEGSTWSAPTLTVTIGGVAYSFSMVPSTTTSATGGMPSVVSNDHTTW